MVVGGGGALEREVADFPALLAAPPLRIALAGPGQARQRHQVLVHLVGIFLLHPPVCDCRRVVGLTELVADETRPRVVRPQRSGGVLAVPRRHPDAASGGRHDE